MTSHSCSAARNDKAPSTVRLRGFGAGNKNPGAVAGVFMTWKSGRYRIVDHSSYMSTVVACQLSEGQPASHHAPTTCPDKRQLEIVLRTQQTKPKPHGAVTCRPRVQ